MAFWKKFYKSKYTGAEIDAAVAKAGTVPAVTSADAGNILGVDAEGKIVAKTDPVPAVTEADIGKMLAVDSLGNIDFENRSKLTVCVISYSGTNFVDSSKTITGNIFLYIDRNYNYTLTESDIFEILAGGGIKFLINNYSTLGYTGILNGDGLQQVVFAVQAVGTTEIHQFMIYTLSQNGIEVWESNDITYTLYDMNF